MELVIQNAGITNFWGIEKGYQLIADAGFAGIDWNWGPIWDKEKLLKKKEPQRCIFDEPFDVVLAAYQPELDMMERYGLKPMQAHAPSPSYVPGFPEATEFVLRTYKTAIKMCDYTDVKWLVIHGASLNLSNHLDTPESIRQHNYELYRRLIPELVETDVVVCLENLFTRHGSQIMEGTCSVAEEAVEYIDRLNEMAGKECFGLCLDTGHLNILGKNQKAYIHTLGTRIKALHLHDNRGMDDDHLAPYAGTIIWKDVIDGLKDVGYSGNLSFETFKQVGLDHLDPEMVPVWLRTIYDIGQVFRKKMKD